MGQETDPLAERSNDSSLELLFILRRGGGKLSRHQNSAVHQSIVLFFYFETTELSTVHNTIPHILNK